MSAGSTISMLKFEFYKCASRLDAVNPSEPIGIEDSHFILWSYYDALIVRRSWSEPEENAVEAINSIHSDAHFFSLNSTASDSPDVFVNDPQNPKTPPLLVIAQISLHEELLRKTARNVSERYMEAQGKDINEAYHAIQAIAKKIKERLDLRDSVWIDVIGAMNAFDLAVVMRGSSMDVMMKRVNRLRETRIKDIAEGMTRGDDFAIQDCYEIFGVEPAMFQKPQNGKIGQAMRKRWAAEENWDNLSIYFDISCYSPEGYRYLVDIINGEYGASLRPRYGKYDELITVNPARGKGDVPQLLYKLFYGDIQLLHTNWMPRESGLNLIANRSEESKPCNPKSKIASVWESKYDKLALQLTNIQMPSDLAEFFSLKSEIKAMRYIARRIEYLGHLQTGSQYNILSSLMDSFFDTVELALEEQTCHPESFHMYLRVLEELTDQIELGCRMNQESLSSQVLHYDNNIKLTIAYITLFQRCLSDINSNIERLKKIETGYQSNSLKTIFAALTDERLITSKLIFSDITDKKAAVVQIPIHKRYHHVLHNIPAYMHELFHYDPPPCREKRNELFISLTISMFFCRENKIMLESILFKNFAERLGSDYTASCLKASEQFYILLRQGVLSTITNKQAELVKFADEAMECLRLYFKQFVGSRLEGRRQIKKLVLDAQMHKTFESIIWQREGRTASAGTRQGLQRILFKRITEDAQSFIYRISIESEFASYTKIVYQLFKEARADWAMCRVIKLDLKQYYLVFYECNIVPALYDPQFDMRFGLISHLLVGKDNENWHEECVETARKVFRERAEPFMRALDNYKIIKYCDIIEDVLWDIFDNDWKKYYDDLANQGEFPTLRAFYQAAKEDSLSGIDEETLHMFLTYWLKSYL